MEDHERPVHQSSGLRFVLYVIALGLLVVFAVGTSQR
jgi:hypothetical protein